VPDQGPELLKEILSRLFTARGWGRRQDRLHLEQAWAEAMTACGLAPNHTCVSCIRRGVLEVLVDNAVMLQEMAHFHKRKLLETLRGKLAGTTINDLRFRAGVVKGK
jgi:predicted nucleic acid-binding Zn ribbon protein